MANYVSMPLIALGFAVFLMRPAWVQELDATCFQAAAPYAPELDIRSDMAIVYGVGEGFGERAAGWRNEGYRVGMMTGIAWGSYGAYYGSGDAFKKDEVQTRKNGSLFMHGSSTNVGYNVPSAAYVEFIKRYIDPALEAGVKAVFFEEPEFWAQAGWSAAFRKEWELFYGEPWLAPDSSPDAQYRASKLKYELYYRALRDVIDHVDRRAQALGTSIECHVPTHSLINYAQWGIVSPESHLFDIPGMDGVIAQVWTGTARTPNVYEGVTKERTFETAFLEYGQMAAMTRPIGKKVWFLADPVEDNPDRSWHDYKRNYENTVVASLMWPDASRFEVMPWPSRIFRGSYRTTDANGPGERVGLLPGYATELLTVITALNNMDQPEVGYETGTRGIGVVVSDTLMFQRAAPHASDGRFGHFYGLTLPLLKAGVPVAPMQLEHAPKPGVLDPYRVLLLTYEGQKPLDPAYHEALTNWVRRGGCLIYFGDGSDPYHGVREWWNENGQTDAKACDDLFKRLGVQQQASETPQPIGKGFVRVVAVNPSDLQHLKEGAERVRQVVREALAAKGEALAMQNHLAVRRGPYLIAAVLDESPAPGDEARFPGTYVDLFDPALPVVKDPVLKVGQRGLWYDLSHVPENQAKVVASACRISEEKADADTFRFACRGPAGVEAVVRLRLPRPPKAVSASPSTDIVRDWDSTSGTLLLEFPNQAREIAITCTY